MSRKRSTQAVVVIHGIGEQRPMATLRKFVQAVLPNRDPGPKFFSKPDPLSDLFDLRTLQNRTQPRTQFFEYYWAHKVTGTQFIHIWRWIKDLLLRWPKAVPRHLLPLWFLSWAVMLVVLTSVGIGAWEAGVTRQLSATPILGPLAGVLLFGLQSLVLSHIGDAARYLNSAPSNIALRREIRADGMALLRDLHQSGRFDRIVVVGHSLGSIIAYDILRNYWSEVHKTYTDPRHDTQEALHALDARAEALRQSGSEEDRRRFRDAQNALWGENRSLGNPWLVTDLITLGSPMAHAALLMAEDKAWLRQRQAERELPTCPPVEDTVSGPDGSPPRISYRVWDRYFDEDGHGYVLRALHHGAPFGVTRWTNLYFRTRYAFFGDPVSGPLAPWFGAGIRDVAVTTKRGALVQNSLAAHTSYWWSGPEHDPKPKTVTHDDRDSVDALIYAMDLQRQRTIVD